MKHVKAMAIKLIAIILICWIILSLLWNIPLMDAVIGGAIVSVMIYVIGDLLVLRKIGNIVATVVDMGGALAILWGYLYLSLGESYFLESLVASAGIAIFEWFFHSWLLKSHVVPDERSMK
ncbi:DUF2512 family protein [Marinilactibacillus piezotolerans]|uniref:DUF2512 family protein n=1 Tax=Marinilactibacillus piezotolerans TaxID=258723 RepID=UPI0009B08990|nr:DUF2512 family protein [Marinilactibacillus piezotolerans]